MLDVWLSISVPGPKRGWLEGREMMGGIGGWRGRFVRLFEGPG